MKKKIFLFAIIFAVMSSVFAEVISFNFGELTDDNIIVTLNTSQSTLDKDIKSTGSSIQVYTKVPFSNHANTMSITFIEPLVIENISNFKSAKLTGKSFCFTGELVTMKRNDAEALVKKNGGSCKSSVTKDLSYLVTNDTTSGSSKNVKAAKLGIPVITEEEFLALIK